MTLIVVCSNVIVGDYKNYQLPHHFISKLSSLSNIATCLQQALLKTLPQQKIKK
jgi:hypothetical protein